MSIAELDALTERYIVPKIFDAIFDSNPLLQKILKSGQYQSWEGGTSIDPPLNYAAVSAAGWYAGSDTLDTTSNEIIQGSRFYWKSAYAGITLAEEDVLKNGGSKGVVKLMAARAQIAEKTLKDNLGTGLYNAGTDAKAIVGLRSMINTSSTYGTISQTANSWWRGQLDSTTTTLSISALNTQFETAAIDNDKPSFIVGTRANYNRYYNLLQPQQRFQDSETASGGFQNLLFNGVPFVSDSHVPTGYIFGLNMNNIFLYYHPERNFKAMPYAKPTNQEVLVGRIIWMGALVSTNNRLHFGFSGITA